jgi:DUF1680 family protein
MDTNIPRRAFLKTAPAAVGFLHLSGRAVPTSKPAPQILLHPFDYQGVRLLDSRWKRQAEMARDYYFGLTNDDILHGFRTEAGLPAPGADPVRGWGIRPTAGAILGQWLSGMARLSRATSDRALHDKAVALLAGWDRTLPGSGGQMSHYQFDKMVGGLVDMHVYGEDDSALPVLARLTDQASASFNRDRVPASSASFFGRPSEWYTLSENLYRAYQATGDERFRSFAEVWLYEPYWSRFADTASPAEVHGVHAYSHVNTFSSAAMHYEITGDPRYLRIVQNAYDYLQNTQCYATGGFGPDERFLAPDGGLGRALEMRPNTFETVCGSWAGFKLSRYLQRFTGEAHYGDWMERLFYNGVGAALPITDDGRNFYYSDYRCTGGMKVYRYDNYTCCSGTYLQCMADFHNLIYYQDDAGVYVNLYVPSEVTWMGSGTGITIRQETDYPVADTITLMVDTPGGEEFALRLRVPQWCDDMSIAVNGSPADVRCTPGAWVTVRRTWSLGDRVDVRIPQRFRWESVDRHHPSRAAIVRGAVVMPLEFRYLEPEFSPPPSDEALNEWLTPDTSDEVVKGLPSRGAYRIRGTNGRVLAAKVRPFFQYTENYPYLMYIDHDDWPAGIW